jgi:hypothetical protein
MAIFPKWVPLREGWRDFRSAITAPRKHKMVFAVASIGAPLGLLAAMFQQAKVDEDYIPPTIVYVKQWDASRTVADVKRQQAIDLPAELAEKKRIADLKEVRRKQFERVAKKMDDLGL